jgi:tetratricopeptide (TPR) repeat protein
MDNRKLLSYYNDHKFQQLIKFGLNNSDDAEARWFLGIAYDQIALSSKSGRRRSLQKNAEKFFKSIMDEKTDKALRGLGTLYLHQNNPKKAILFYKKARNLDPKDSSNLISIGNAYRAMGNIGLAIRWYKSVFKSARADRQTKLVALTNIALLTDAENVKNLASECVDAAHKIVKTPSEVSKDLRIRLKQTQNK